MIQSIAHLLEEIQKKGTELIKKYKIINHPVLIGDMYEGLTKEILNASIFGNLNLKVVAGKIKNNKGLLSDEIDCMLVEGEGDSIPFTDKFIYHYNQVIAVIQVKKSLHTNSLNDSYTNLKSVIDVSKDPEQDSEAYLQNLHRDAYRSLLRTELPRRSELHNYSTVEQHLYHSLLMEAYFPIRIVFGFLGFKSEYNLREGFAKMLEGKIEGGPARGYGAISMPNLVICNELCIVKNNGMPFCKSFLNQEYYWALYLSSPNNSIRFLLEVIWTRLSYKYSISSDIFDSDFGPEQMHGYINTKLGYYDGDKMGWMYSYQKSSTKELRESIVQKQDWSPKFLTQEQYTVILLLIEFEEINSGDANFKQLIRDWKYDPRSFVERLIETDLVYERNDVLRLLTDQCATVILPDGRFCVGENKSGEFTTWINNYLTEKK